LGFRKKKFLNLVYGYVGGSPLIYTDLNGLILFPGQSPIEVYGGTSEQQAQVVAAANRVLSTPRGQEMLAKIKASQRGQRHYPTNVDGLS
jgi:hypothetical protein